MVLPENNVQETTVVGGGITKVLTRTAAPAAVTIVTTASDGARLTLTSLLPGVFGTNTAAADGDPDKKGGANLGLVLGIVIAVIVLLVLVGAALWFGIKHGKKKAEAAAAAAAAPPTAIYPPAPAPTYQPPTPVYPPVHNYVDTTSAVAEKDGNVNVAADPVHNGPNYYDHGDARELGGTEVPRS